MDRYFIVGASGRIQFSIEGGAVLIPVQEVTPGLANANLIPLEPDEMILDSVCGEGNWGNDDVIAVGQAMLAQRYPSDTVRLYTPAQWAAQPSVPADRDAPATAEQLVLGAREAKAALIASAEPVSVGELPALGELSVEPAR